MSFTDHPTADQIVVSHPADGPVGSTVMSWNGRALASMTPCSVGYAVSTGTQHPEPNHRLWAGASWEDALRRTRECAGLAAMMIAENRPGWA